MDDHSEYAYKAKFNMINYIIHLFYYTIIEAKTKTILSEIIMSLNTY